MWVATTALATIFRVGTRREQDPTALIGEGSAFGRDLVCDLRRLIERVHDGEGGDTAAVKRLVARIADAEHQ